jgi:hypothetical protein
MAASSTVALSQKQHRKQEKALKQLRGLEEQRRAALKTLAREAAHLISSGGASLVNVPQKQDAGRRRGGWPKGRPRGKKSLPPTDVSESIEDYCEDDDDTAATSSLDDALCTGTLIRYSFHLEDTTADVMWRVGMVHASWHKQSWYMVMFEDGSNLWVRLDPEAKGLKWEGVTGDFCAAVVETARFERSLGAANPEALALLRRQLASAISPQVIAKFERKRGRPVGR